MNLLWIGDDKNHSTSYNYDLRSVSHDDVVYLIQDLCIAH